METEAIAAALGGRKVLKAAVKKPDDLAQLIRKGLPAKAVTALAETLHLGNAVLSRKLGIPQRTMTRRLSHASPLTPAESDRAVRMARVYANAVEMIGDRAKAIEWLSTPNRALGGERPLDQLDTDMGRPNGGGCPRPHRLWRVQLMRFWRICRRRYAAEAATGEGARLYGGRWNSRGVRVVYASTSLALAAVETFVNVEPNLRPADLVSIEGKIPENVQVARLAAEALPPHWYASRDESLRGFGDEWISRGNSVGLLVPSAAIRGEWNLLLNPTHFDFRLIEFRNPEPFEFDARMFR
jgi:putative toxin-antitoxin system antitoxin component (TIGR02293 family)